MELLLRNVGCAEVGEVEPINALKEDTTDGEIVVAVCGVAAKVWWCCDGQGNLSQELGDAAAPVCVYCV